MFVSSCCSLLFSSSAPRLKPCTVSAGDGESESVAVGEKPFQDAQQTADQHLGSFLTDVTISKSFSGLCLRKQVNNDVNL